MQIIIQRHGEPDLEPWGKINTKQMSEWINAYNRSAVSRNNPPCKKSISNAQKSTVVCSTLERSKDSVKLLGVANFKNYKLFNEAELPVINLPVLKLMPYIWSVIFRIFWFLGLSKDVESKKEIAVRVKLACQILENLAITHTNILLVGHGVMNRLIAKKLVESGWNAETAPNEKTHYGSHYWEYSKFTK